jgi:hypothetical protein
MRSAHFQAIPAVRTREGPPGDQLFSYNTPQGYGASVALFLAPIRSDERLPNPQAHQRHALPVSSGLDSLEAVGV